ncbi:hypothetical protein M1N19_02905 [Dehalococcoidia bacterium]|nr:hypothetical protein [Dehalococcoidia bacterium]
MKELQQVVMGSNTTSELKKRVIADDVPYQRFDKKLEQEHKGEFIAIGRNGAVIVPRSVLCFNGSRIASFCVKRRRLLTGRYNKTNP